MSKTYHIFISHSWKYSDAYEKLIHLLDNAEDFAYCDYSVPEDDPIEDATTGSCNQRTDGTRKCRTCLGRCIFFVQQVD